MFRTSHLNLSLKDYKVALRLMVSFKYSGSNYIPV